MGKNAVNGDISELKVPTDPASLKKNSSHIKVANRTGPSEESRVVEKKEYGYRLLQRTVKPSRNPSSIAVIDQLNPDTTIVGIFGGSTELKNDTQGQFAHSGSVQQLLGMDI